MGTGASLHSNSLWFYNLFGFAEQIKEPLYDGTKAAFKVDGPVITCSETKRSFLCGRFVRETLGEQRARVLGNQKLQATLGKKRGLTLNVVTGDVSKLHAQMENKNATFQVVYA